MFFVSKTTQFWIIVIAIVIVIAVMVIYRAHCKKPSVIKKKKRREIDRLDQKPVRTELIKKEEGEDLDKLYGNLDADELFTRAMVYLRERDDLQDACAVEKSQMHKRELEKKLLRIDARTKKLMSLAIARRNEEKMAGGDKVREQVVHDGLIEMRAVEIGMPELANAIIRDREHARDHNRAAFEWAADAQNVHDSAVGSGVSEHLRRIMQDDIHVHAKNETIGAILLALKNRRKEGAISKEKSDNIIKTLRIAGREEFCGRYGIDELEALRLVFERAYHTDQEETKNNLHDSLFDALNESPNVCLVGRISRYAASLDAVDPAFVDSSVMKSADVYRAEILEKLGKVQAGGTEPTKESITLLVNEYKGKVPENVLKKITDECVAAIV